MQRPQDSPDTRRQIAVSENPLGRAAPAPPRIAKSHVGRQFLGQRRGHSSGLGSKQHSDALGQQLEDRVGKLAWLPSSAPASGSASARASRPPRRPANTPAASSASIQPGLASSPAIARHLGCDPKTVQRTLRAPSPWSRRARERALSRDQARQKSHAAAEEGFRAPAAHSLGKDNGVCRTQLPDPKRKD